MSSKTLLIIFAALFIGVVFATTWFLWRNYEQLFVETAADNSRSDNKESVLATARLLVNGAPLTVELAQTGSELTRGLSGRDSLADGYGMLLMHNEPGYYGVWMKDMNFPLDVVWLDGQGRVVEILYRITPDTYPETFAPQIRAQYTLEIAAGAADSYDLNIGDQIDLTAL